MIKRSLLLVEDNVMNQKLIILYLAKYGFHIDVAVDGMEALEKVKKNRYDLILMDLMMPVMDGLEATRRIREWEEENGVSNIIVGLTANAYDTDRDKCMEHGMNEFMTKPFDIDQFLGILNELGIEVSRN